MGIWSDLSKAKASGGGRRYFKAGVHRIRIDGVKFDKSRTGVEYFAVTGTILATNSSDPEMSPSNNIDWSTHKDKDAYFGNIKQFVCAATGTMEKDFDELGEAQGNQLMDVVAGTKQALTGRAIEAVCIDQTSKAGNAYVAVRWQTVPESAARAA